MERSCLFVPGDRLDRFDKATQSGAHAVVIDLEDAVQPEAKDKARATLAGWLGRGPDAAAGIWVRINGIGTEWHDADLAVLADPRVDVVMLPKAEEEASLAAFLAALPRALPTIALIETALGLRNVESIASMPGVARLGFGSVDFQLDTGIENEDEGLLYARSEIVIASALARLPAPLDGVSVALDDEAGLKRDTARARGMGFGGKMCIHPRQVEAVNQGFAPTAQELDWARRVVKAAGAGGALGAVRLDGRMIDAPVVARARRMLEANP